MTELDVVPPVLTLRKPVTSGFSSTPRGDERRGERGGSGRVGKEGRMGCNLVGRSLERSVRPEERGGTDLPEGGDCSSSSSCDYSTLRQSTSLTCRRTRGHTVVDVCREVSLIYFSEWVVD